MLQAPLILFLAVSAPSLQSSTSGPLTREAAGQPVVRAAKSSDFVPIADVRELSARLIVRPRQVRDLLTAGLDIEEAWSRRADARKQLEPYQLVRHVPSTDEYILQLARVGDEEASAAALMLSGNFEYAEPDWLLAPSASSVPGPVAQNGQKKTGPYAPMTPRLVSNCSDDPLRPGQWHHAAINSCPGWSFETGAPSVSVGICDTGLNLNHEDLQLHRLEGYNAVDQLWESQGGNISAVYHHGTRTTGVAAANGNNALGVTGIGWDLSHRMLRVSNMSNGNAFLSDLQHGARTSIETGDRVANVSYAGVTSLSNLTTATYIKQLGGLLVWSAGNSSGNVSNADRDADDLLVVGASNELDELAYFSNYGNFVDLVAPGINMLTTDSYSNNGYVTTYGTSFAAPLVSGLCAMLWSKNPKLSPNDVEFILKAACEDLGAPGLDDQFGYGRIDLQRALTFDASSTPMADFGTNTLQGAAPLAVDFRDLSSGIPTQWSWDFGDGGTSTLQNPLHVYTASGFFTVTLVAQNQHGTDSVTKADYVITDFIPPSPEFAATPTGGLAPMTVSFTDQSNLLTGGVPTAWSWDFGDGNTSTEQHPTHVYTSSGYYTVDLFASNVYGSASLTKTNYIAVDFIPPVAEFSAQPTVGNSPYVVSFTDESTGGVPASWLWFFGDGSSSTARHPAHTYTLPGLYTVQLTATNAYGSDTLVKTGLVDVGPGPTIVANFIGTPTTGTAPLTVDFTDLSVGNVVAWDWQFGDGTTSNLPSPTHTYTAAGQYSVSLQVDDLDGKDSQLELEDYITVQ